MLKKGEKKGQITIFIIVGIVIVVGILLFFLFRKGVIPIPGGGKSEENPVSYMESCIEPKIKEAIEIISSQGGYINNNLNIRFKFDEDKEAKNISYLCYNQNYYLSCINQEPMLIQHLKEEIKTYIKKDVENCVRNLKKSLENSGYEVDMNYRDFSIELIPKKVLVTMDMDVTFSKSGETSTRDNFKFAVASRFYDISIVVQEIVSQEARFCNFEQLGYMLFYPDYNIDKFRTGESTTIYSVADRETKEKFRFAVRGCVIPPGF